MTDKTAEALAALDTQLAELIDSGRWTDYLDFQTRFHTYSANNVMLIMAQMPTATHVAGYQAWKKDHGRQVRKGEHGLRILAPCTVWKDKDNHDAGRTLIGFRVTSVFDVSQTDGEPLPSVVDHLTGDAPDHLLAGLVDAITAAGYTYERGPTGTANGYTDYTGRTVRVSDTLTGAMAAKTTAHELAHVLMHHPDSDRPARDVCEIEAESVAYVVMAAHGIDSGGYTLGYVAGWSGGDVATVKTTATRVAAHAKKILATLSTDTAKEAAA